VLGPDRDQRASDVRRISGGCSRRPPSPFPVAGRDTDIPSAPIAPPRQEDEMVPFTDGDDIANILREHRDDEALAREEARQAHTLIPPEIAAQLPPLYANEGQSEEAVAHLKLFTPWTNWTWYASEYDPEERLCFGVVIGHERELGYFSIAELEAIRGPGGLRIERDLHWTPRPLKECR
jgi:hypothetical protein